MGVIQRSNLNRDVICPRLHILATVVFPRIKMFSMCFSSDTSWASHGRIKYQITLCLKKLTFPPCTRCSSRGICAGWVLLSEWKMDGCQWISYMVSWMRVLGHADVCKHDLLALGIDIDTWEVKASNKARRRAISDALSDFEQYLRLRSELKRIRRKARSQSDSHNRHCTGNCLPTLP